MMRFAKASAAGLTLAIAEYVADAAQQPDVIGGALKLAYSDCGDGATHGKFTSLSPTSVTLGNKTPLKGKGTIDENIKAATYEVEAKALFVTVFKHSGDACKAESIKLPAGAGTIDMHGFKCPLAKGDVELDLDLNLAGSIPAQLARLTIDLKAKTNTGDKALCAQIKTSPVDAKASTGGLALTDAMNIADAEQQPEVTGGALKLAYSDCGDAATHGKFTSLSPTSVNLGNKTPLKGKGTIDENIQAATYEVDAKALFVTVFKHSGDACKAESIKLPAGAGTIDMHGFKCPLAKGDVELDLDLNLAGSIPAQLARLTIDLKAKTNTGDKALCAQIKTSPTTEVNQEVVV